MGVVGIDLAGSERRDTGYCSLRGRKTNAAIMHDDREILDALRKDGPALVAIDAPLSLPKGRKSIHERDSHHFRKCDLELRKLGIRFFPITLGPMRMLTGRGMELKKKIMLALPSASVIEVYPGATYDLLGTNRKNKKAIRALFRRFGIVLPRRALTQDELDGVCCALTGMLFLRGRARDIGDPREGTIVVPVRAVTKKGKT